MSSVKAIGINICMGNMRKRLWYEVETEYEEHFLSIAKKINELSDELSWNDFIIEVVELFSEHGYSRIAL